MLSVPFLMKRHYLFACALAVAFGAASIGGGVWYTAYRAAANRAAAPLPYSYEEMESMNGEELVAKLTPLAEAGNTEAMVRLGYAYFNGHNGLTRDWGKVEKWFCMAADHGDAGIISMLATDVEFSSFDPDGKYYRLWLKQEEAAAEKGDADAMWQLAENCGIPRIHTRSQPEKAHYWFCKALETGNEEAGLSALDAILTSDKPCDEEAKKRLNKAMGAHGTPEAAAAEGYCYEKGIDRPADAAKAAELYAQSTRSSAQRRLARLYEAGRGVAQDFAKAAELYEESGDAFGIARCAELSRMQEAHIPDEELRFVAARTDNPYTARREACAVQLKTAGNEAEQRELAEQLAEMYVYGRGGAADMKEAIRLNTLAENLTHEASAAPAETATPAGEVPNHAACRLMNAILTGERETLPAKLPAEEQRQLVDRLRREALFGCGDAQFALSLAYRTGYGNTPVDGQMADKWRDAAASTSYLPALLDAATQIQEGTIVRYQYPEQQEYALRELQALMQGTDEEFATRSVTALAYFYALADEEQGDWSNVLYQLKEYPQGVNTSLPHGETPLQLAFRFGKASRIIRLMAEGANLPTDQAWLNAELRRALLLNRAEVARILAAAGAETQQSLPEAQGITATTETWLTEAIICMVKPLNEELSTVRDTNTAEKAAAKIEPLLRRLSTWLAFAESYAKVSGNSAAFRLHVHTTPELLQMQQQISRCRKEGFFGSDNLKAVITNASSRKGSKACTIFTIKHPLSHCYEATRTITDLHHLAGSAPRLLAYEPAMRQVLSSALDDIATLSLYADPADAEDANKQEQLAELREGAEKSYRLCLPLWQKSNGADAEWHHIIRALAPMLPAGDFPFRRLMEKE